MDSLIKPNIFILDDSPSELNYIEALLNQEGYLAIPSRNRKNFYGLLERFDADLILLDIVMPENDGFSICKELKSHVKYRKIPIIFLTALTNDADIKKGLEYGAVDFISKPFNQAIFLLRIKSVLNQNKQLFKYNALFNNMNEGSCLFEPIYNKEHTLIDIRHIDFNKAYLNLLNISEIDLTCKTWLDILPNTEHTWFLKLQDLIENQQQNIVIFYESLQKWLSIKAYTISKHTFAMVISDITDQKKLEKSLTDSKEKYRIIADNIGDWVWKSDLNLNFTYVSPAATKIRGLTIKELYDEKLEDAFPPESIIKAKTALGEKLSLIKQNQAEGWEPVTLELQIYKKDKSLFWTQIKARFLKGADGLPAEIIGSARDIDSQKQAELALAKSENRYRALFEGSKDPVLLIKNNLFIECNQSTIDVFGYKTREIFLTLKPQDISPKYQPDGQLSKTKALHALNITNKKGQHSFEWLHLHSSGKPIWVHISMAKVALKGEQFFYTVLRDITTKKKAELALIESEEKYRLITDNISDLVWKTDLNMKFTYISPSIIKFRGSTVEEAMKQKLNEILNPESLKKVKKILKTKLDQINNGDAAGWEATILDIILYKKDGTEFWAQISARFIKGKDGYPTEIIGVTRNISQQKQAELALSKSQKELIQINKDKDTFISILSHDLIGSIGGSMQVIELLEHKGIDWDKRDNFVDYLCDNTKSAYDLLSNIVAWGKASLGKDMFVPSQYNLYQILMDIKQLYHAQLKQKQLTLEIDINPNQMVYADCHMLEAIFRNLIRNSIKYTEPNGIIKVSCEIKQKTHRISIHDTGVGMSKSKADKLFTLESVESKSGTDGEKGTGIGLQIAKEYVMKHQGKIWAESSINKGTTVYFTLPF